ncbi:ABC transporter ATP-binding protein [Arthrobacter sp. H35-D1]|uniref:ABC transporter ATP-binding protein n=1 Tax=Arthrobacter sp. H35-D1 TaxID=3046202 RepID=UPI0024B91FF7|nr:ABC transporter ATP-binding protein [Arthrobacter sp. H35-D1]MDJ0314820.1 ABC transporter ATP-binding protein [Arthrobacter sp. H35-D1]
MPGEAAAVELVAASKKYREGAALQPTNLVVQRGQVHALVGLNGTGKTTLLRLVLGITAPTAGRVLVRGVDVARMKPAGWAGVGHLIDTPLVYPELTVQANLQIAGRLSGLGLGSGRAAARRLAEELLLTKWWTRRARTLSLGNRQRLGIAAALVADPDVMVLDEPTNALDPAGTVLVRRMLLERVRETGASVLVSSHHLDEVARIADQITVINSGRIIGTLAPDGIDLERRFFNLVNADVEANQRQANP